MALPPKDIEPGALWQKLHDERQPSEVVDFPRKGHDGQPIGQIRIVRLAMPDHDWAREEANRRIKAKKIDREDVAAGAPLRELHADITARCLLSRACCAVEPIEGSENTAQGPQYGKVFPLPEHLDVLTADELNVLFTQYMMVQDKFGPYAGHIVSEEELNAWIKILAEGANEVPLARFNWRRLAGLTSSLAKRAYSACALLAFQSSSSPNTSASPPASWNCDTSFYGAAHATRIVPGLIPGVEPAPSPTRSMFSGDSAAPAEPITLEEATERAEELGYAGGEEPDIES